MKLGKPIVVEDQDDNNSTEAERNSDAKLNEVDQEFFAQSLSKSDGDEKEEDFGNVLTE